MKCPKCGGPTIATEIRYKDDGDERRRKCIDCGYALWTAERVKAADETQAYQASLFKLMTDGDARDQARQLCAERKEND